MKRLALTAAMCLLGACVAPSLQPDGNLRLVSEDEAVAITGGGCGWEWIAGTVACPTGTVLCGGLAEDCTEITFESLVQDGDGDEVKKDQTGNTCAVCGTNCGYVNSVDTTRGCSST